MEVDDDSTSLVADYLNITADMRQLYGERTIIFMQVGSWFELYDMEEDSIQINACKNILGLKAVKRKNDFFQCGIPSDKGDHFMRNVIKLLENGFTIVQIIQEDYEKDIKLRKIHKIYSPGCHISDDDTYESILIVALFIEYENYVFASSSKIDNNLGFIEYITSTFTNKNDALKWFTDFIYEIGNCAEICLYFKSCFDTSNNNRWNEFKKLCIFDIVSQHYFNLNENPRPYIFDPLFQEKILCDIFPQYNQMGGSVIFHLNMQELSKDEIACIIFLILFVRQHDEDLIKKLSPPTCLSKKKTTHTRCINSLFDKMDIFTEKRGLFEMLRKQKTKLGERYLRKLLISPIFNKTILQQRYECILMFQDIFQDSNRLENMLVNISDIERLQRKMNTCRISPIDVCKLFNSYQSIKELHQYVSSYFIDNKTFENILYNIDSYHLSRINELLCFMENTFDFEKCQKNTHGLQNSRFEDIVALETRENELYSNITNIINELVQFLPTTKNNESIKLVQSANGEYSIQTTTKRGQILEKNLKNNNYIAANLTSITIVHSKNTAYIHGYFDSDLIEYSTIRTKIMDKTREIFQEQTLSVLSISEDVCDISAKFVASIDVFSSIAKISQKNGYVKPIFHEITGQITASKIRHPIVEKLVTQEGKQYIPNDISIGPTESWLLYGVNSVGKSSLLKSIVINVLLAQCGFFVAAESFYYQPFLTIGCRIGNNDDIYLGQSSFIKELIEMNNIFLYTKVPPCLIITDEMCSSTETQAAIKCVASFIVFMSERRITWACATHLKELQNNNYIKGLQNVKNKHLKVNINDNIVEFERSLHDGLPDIDDYGSLIAKLMIKDKRFHELMDSKFHIEEESIDSFITHSRYNRRMLKIECEVCKYRPLKSTDERLHTHHLQFQCNADDFRNVENGIHIHNQSNLVTLCKSCHAKVHENKIVLECKTTSQGRNLVVHHQA